MNKLCIKYNASTAHVTCSPLINEVTLTQQVDSNVISGVEDRVQTKNHLRDTCRMADYVLPINTILDL
jgi:hypothetical protein